MLRDDGVAFCVESHQAPQAPQATSCHCAEWVTHNEYHYGGDRRCTNALNRQIKCEQLANRRKPWPELSLFARRPDSGSRARQSFWRDDAFFTSRHNRCPRAVLVLLGRKARCVGGKRGIYRLVLACREILVKVRFDWPRLAVDKRGNVKGLLIGQHGGEVGDAAGHVAFDKTCSQRHAAHAGAIVVAVGAPQRRKLVAIGITDLAAAHALAVFTVTRNAGAGVDQFSGNRVSRTRQIFEFERAAALQLQPDQKTHPPNVEIFYICN